MKKLVISILCLIVLGSLTTLNSCKKDEQNNTPEPTTISDNEDNVYNIITIGTQKWMGENLKTRHYNNGNLIATAHPDSMYSTDTTLKFQWAYDRNESSVSTYGRLYTWYAITDSRGVCPNGWHIPSDIEWQALSDFLGGDEVAGGKMKEAGYTHWPIPNTGADNSSGFKGLPAGVLTTVVENYIGTTSFKGLLGYTQFWSSTEIDEYTAINRELSDGSAELYRETGSYIYNYKESGFSVRCIKN